MAVRFLRGSATLAFVYLLPVVQTLPSPSPLDLQPGEAISNIEALGSVSTSHNMTATTIAALFDPANDFVTSALTSKNMTQFAALVSALESNTLVSDVPPKFESTSSNGADNTLSYAPPDPTTRYTGDYAMIFQYYKLTAPRSPIDEAPQFAADVYYYLSVNLQRQPDADLETLWPTNANPELRMYYNRGAPLFRPGLSFIASCENGYGGGTMSYKDLLLAVRMWGAWTLNAAWRVGGHPDGVAGCDMRMRLEGLTLDVPILGAEFRVGLVAQGIVNRPQNFQTA